MQDSEKPSPATSKRTPWNKGKLTGAKPPLRPKHVWSIALSFKWQTASATWRCSISPSIASCVVAMSSLSKSRTLPHTDTPLSVRRSARRRPADRYGSRSPNKPGKRLMTTCVWRTGSTDNSFLPHNVGPSRAFRPDNMPVSSATGYVVLGSIRACSVRIHCGGPSHADLSPHRQSAGRPICCSVTPRSRARFAISVSRSMTLWPSPSKRNKSFCGA
jgi:hypothetical protein